MAIVMEYAGGGELFEYVANTGRFTEPVARTYFHQMVEALEYIHNQGIAHRDMKPENLLFSEDFILKVADFGFSTMLQGRDGSG
jgi:serine/threonine protein kinase